MSSAPRLPAANPVDLTNCDREPIHIPGSIQPHGILFTLDEQKFRVLQATADAAARLGQASGGEETLLGLTLGEIVTTDSWPAFTQALSSPTLEACPLYVANVQSRWNASEYFAVAHRFGGVLFLELEPTTLEKDIGFQNLYPLVRSFMSNVRSVTTLSGLAQVAADEVRRITGYGRVLIYRFDSNWNGNVIAESRDSHYPSFLDLWFPASDIPRQARELYTKNRIRLISNSSYRAVPLLPPDHPATGQPPDMSYVSLRSVSPVHLEYLQNMGVISSMSMSLVLDDSRLWGLIACHHAEQRFIPFDVRTACEMLAQSLSVHIEAAEQRSAYEQRLHLKSGTARLLSYMAQEEEFIDGLTRHPDELLSFVNARGAAVVFDGQCHRMGDCPGESDIWRLVDWLLAGGRKEVFATDRLSLEFPNGEHFRKLSSGLLAISISRIHRSYVLWFRPEIIRTVTWAGDPEKPVEPNTQRLSPRRSFEAWKQTVRDLSAPWLASEVEAAGELRNAVLGVVLHRAEELAQLSAELQRSNSELEAFSYSVSHDLRAPFRHIVGYAELLRTSPTIQLSPKDERYLSVIVKSAHFAGTLVDNLLHYSQVGRAKLKLQTVDMKTLVEELRREFERDLTGRILDWQVSELPAVQGDVVLLRLAVQNLLENAIKYTREQPHAVIRIGASRNEGETVFSIADNGIGFDQAYADKVFGVFQRLHKMEDYEGTGIGLANVRRVIAKHGGRTWAESSVGHGAAFFFSIPERMSLA